jgi:hypothetical protein
MKSIAWSAPDVNVYSDGSIGHYWRSRKAADSARRMHHDAHGMPCAYRIVATEKRPGVFDQLQFVVGAARKLGRLI